MYKCDTLIDTVVNRDLCTLCGTCAGCCPADVFTLRGDLLSARAGECTNCGICLDVCPGAAFDYPTFHKSLFGTEQDAAAPLGHYEQIWRGYALDERIRQASASGGAITALLCSMLQSGRIDGAVVILQDEQNPRRFYPEIATTQEQIIAAAQSKYLFVPTNEIIAKVKCFDGKVAYTALPCQIEGLCKARARDKQLNEKIALTVALFCGFNMYQAATDYLIRKSKMAPADIVSLQYRAKRGDATGFLVKSKTGKEFFVDKHEYTFLNLVYTSPRCMKCYDFSGEFADISVGDAWEQAGTSRIIARTSVGVEAIQAAQDTLHLDASSEDAIHQTQAHLLRHKKRNIWYRQEKFDTFPNYGVPTPILDTRERKKARNFYTGFKLASSVFFKAMLSIIPFSLLRKASKKGRSASRDSA